MVVLTASPVDAEIVAQVDGLAVRRDGTVSGTCMVGARGHYSESAYSLEMCDMVCAREEQHFLIFSPLPLMQVVAATSRVFGNQWDGVVTALFEGAQKSCHMPCG